MLEDLFLLIAAVWIMGRVFHSLRLPMVFGELLAGIVMGPVVLGMVHETEAIKTIAELGIFFLMLHAGIETEPRDFFSALKGSFIIALGGMIIPFAGGYGVGVAMGYDTAEALYIGLGLSVTSIVICARMIKDTGIGGTKVAHITMGSALIDDILALILFSVIVNVTSSGTINIGDIVFLIFKIIAFFGIVMGLGYKYSKYLRNITVLGNKGFTFLVTIAFGFGVIAELLGLHMIIGAFMAGLFIRQEVMDRRVFAKTEDRIFGISHSLFGPVFIATIAFHLDFSILIENPFFVLFMLVVAILGKVLGSAIPAILAKTKWSDAIAIGLAMNNRGEVALILAMIGLSSGVISDDVFSALVLTAFFTTLFSLFAFPAFTKKFPPGMQHTTKNIPRSMDP